MEHPDDQLLAFRFHLATVVTGHEYFHNHSNEVENGQRVMAFVTERIDLCCLVEIKFKLYDLL